jgi:glycosyltransferase involved in cell wall biosynthesis
VHILVVSQYFWPENFRINDLCEELIKRGHKVTVLTGEPNYPSGSIYTEFKHNPTHYSNYNGCRIIRVPIVARGTGNSIKLILNYISYVLSASLIGFWKIRSQSFDVIFVYEPSPVTVGLPAIFFKKIKKVPVVFWVLDLWPETLEAIGVINSPMVLNWIGKLVKFIYNRCDLVLGQSKAFFESIAQYCDDKNKIKYFPSWSDNIFSMKNTNEVATEIAGYDDYFKVLFAGNIGEAQDFPSILKAALILKEKDIKAKIFVLGNGRAFESVCIEIKRLGLEDIVFMLGQYPLECMPAFYDSSDALLVTLKESKAFSMTIPGKVQSYMAAGKPILSMLTGEGSRVIDEAQCGLTSKSGDYQKLAENIIGMSKFSMGYLVKLGENSRKYTKTEFDRGALICQLENLFNDVVTSSSQKKQ